MQADRYDIIADLHGDTDRMEALLEGLGYDLYRSRHPAGHMAVFLGDFIDRGPDGLGVLRRVSRMREAGSAIAIMGNHELNAMLYHAEGEDGRPLRKRDRGNMTQHEAFLAQCPVGSANAREALAIMATLPLFWEGEDFRAVHACWSDRLADAILSRRPDGTLRPEDLPAIAQRPDGDAFSEAVNVMTKGPEVRLAEGYYLDKHGGKRRKARVKWWDAGDSLHGCIASVPDLGHVPNGPVPADMAAWLYPEDGKPVVFGHYQISEGPAFFRNTVCLDVPTDPVALVWHRGAEAGFVYRPGDPEPRRENAAMGM